MLLSSMICVVRMAPIQFDQDTATKTWNSFDLLNQYMSMLNIKDVNKFQSDSYLNTLAQAVADNARQTPSAVELIKSNPNSDENILVYGIKLRGDTTYKKIFAEDLNCNYT